MAGREFHEDLIGNLEIRGPSDRNFGVSLAAICIVLGCWPLWHGGAARPILLVLATLLLLVAALRPSVLHWPNRLWTGLSRALGRVTNPIVTAVLFFLVFVPAGLVLRLTGKDLLRLRFDPRSDSYWIPRSPGRPAASSMKDPF